MRRRKDKEQRREKNMVRQGGQREGDERGPGTVGRRKKREDDGWRKSG